MREFIFKSASVLIFALLSFDAGSKSIDDAKTSVTLDFTIGGKF